MVEFPVSHFYRLTIRSKNMPNYADLMRILKLHLIMRIEKDYSNIVKYIPFVKRIKNIIIFKSITFGLISTMTAVFLYFKFQFMINQWTEMITVIIVAIFCILSLINGASSYRRTHFPIYQDLYHVSPLSNQVIFIILLVEELLWSLIQSSGLLVTLFICMYLILKPTVIVFIMIVINLLALFTFIFITSNRLWGMYQIFKLKNKIGFIRFFAYLIAAIISLLVGFAFSIMISKPIFALRNNFESIDQLLGDQYWGAVKKAIFHDFNQTFIVFKGIVIDNLYSFFIANTNIISLVVVFILLFTCIILLLRYLYPNYSVTRHLKNDKESGDWLTFYVQLISRLFNHKNDILFQKELINLERSRWIVSPGIFAITLYSLEGFFYFGILWAIGTLSTNTSLILAMLLLFNVLTIIIHCFEVSYEYPQIFSLGSEGENIDLYRLSPNGVSHIFYVKLKLLKSILFIPLTINVVLSILFMTITHTLSLESILLAGLLILLYKVSPLIQLYMSPFYSKFSYNDVQEVGNTYDEQELHSKFQAIPRYFILVPLMVFSFLNLFIPIYKLIPEIHFFYFIGFSIPMIIFLFISKNIIKMGLNRLGRK